MDSQPTDQKNQSNQNIQKIAVIGNAGAGKTTLSRRLHEIYQIPLTHVDSIQFVAGMQIRPYKESIQMLNQIQDQDSWIIDGYGPLDILQPRLQKADRIVFIDFPIWRHYWWCTKRQIQNIWSRRQELPEECNELTWQHTLKLFKTIHRVHKLMRPELLRILQREQLKNKVVRISHLKEWNEVFQKGFN
jgi:adenylate kinase family enzyme